MKELIEFLEKSGLKDKADRLREDDKMLYFQYNNIGDAGAMALAASLKDNKSLTSLELGMNNIGKVTLDTINE